MVTRRFTGMPPVPLVLTCQRDTRACRPGNYQLNCTTAALSSYQVTVAEWPHDASACIYFISLSSKCHSIRRPTSCRGRTETRSHYIGRCNTSYTGCLFDGELHSRFRNRCPIRLRNIQEIHVVLLEDSANSRTCSEPAIVAFLLPVLILWNTLTNDL